MIIGERTTRSGTVTVRHGVMIKTVGITKTLAAYEMTTNNTVLDRNGTIRVNGPYIHPVNDSKTEITEGIIDFDNLAKFYAGKAWKPSELQIFPLDLIEDIRLKGRERVFRVGSHTAYDRIIDKPYKAFVEGSATVANLVRKDDYNGMFFDHSGKPLPMALEFDYITGQFANDVYDLKKAVAHLATRSDVTLVESYHSAILPIPHYNADKYRSHYIDLLWSPSAEDFERMMVATDNQYGRLDLYAKAIFDLDLLGLRAAGAAYFESYYESFNSSNFRP